MFTIAGAKKKLQAEQREGSKAKAARQASAAVQNIPAVPMLTHLPSSIDVYEGDNTVPTVPIPRLTVSLVTDQREALKTLGLTSAGTQRHAEDLA